MTRRQKPVDPLETSVLFDEFALNTAHPAANSRFEVAYAAFARALPVGEEDAKAGLRTVRDAADAARAALAEAENGLAARPSPRRPAGRAG